MHQFYTPDIIGNSYTLNEEESSHCIRVLRLKKGSVIQLLNGKGKLYIAEIIDEHPKKCVVKVIDEKSHPAKNWKLSIAIAPTKSMDRLEWFVEKSTEIGIENIIPINCTNSERLVLKIERLIKVAISAIKQSGNTFLPAITQLFDFEELIEKHKEFKGQKFIAHCNSADEKYLLKNVFLKEIDTLILIGPEGDFTSDEIKLALNNGFQQISLGGNRLRTETAALYACTLSNILNDH